MEALGAPVFILQQEGWATVHKRQFFSQRAAKCGLHNSVNLASVHRNWTLACLVTF